MKNLLFLLLSMNLIFSNLRADESQGFIEQENDFRISHISEIRKDLSGIARAIKENDVFKIISKMKKTDPLNQDQKDLILSTWMYYIKLHLKLDSIINEAYQENSKVPRYIAYYAFVVQYRSAIDFLRTTKKYPHIEFLLNEAHQELGLKKETYTKFAGEFLSFFKYSAFYEYRINFQDKLPDSFVKLKFNDDEKVIREFNRYKRIFYAIENNKKIVSSFLFKMYFPVQKNVSEWMGDVRVKHGKEFMISDEQIKEVQERSLPGDIFIERRNWFLSNIGLPGFWPHAALYIGKVEERRHFLTDDETTEWVKSQGVDSGNFEDLLKITYPKAYVESLKQDEYGHDHRILESMSEGVVFTSIEHSADADSLAVLRPKLSNLELAKAIFTAFKYQGRPYDFNFDFRTDSEVVCSELVFYAFQKTDHKGGLNFPVTVTLGRPVVTPNNIIKEFAMNHQTENEQYDFVLFLDGHEKTRKATFEDVELLKKSWNRPKWYIFTNH